MTIATFQFEAIGVHAYLPEGPYGSAGNFPQPSFKPGTVMAGDNGAEFIFLLLDVVTAFTANQGDFYCWDQSMAAARVGEISVANEYDIGLNVGTIFFGGRCGDPASAPFAGDVWSYTFAVGLYGCWFQRAGISLGHINASTNVLTAAPSTIGGTAGIITYTTAVATKSNAFQIGAIGLMPISKTFTADALTGSATLLNANVGKYIQKGMTVTGTGIPGTTASPVTTIIDINGPTITLSAAATATNVGTTITARAGFTSGTTLLNSPVLTGVPSILGVYPNQTITGTGIPASTTILSIAGNSGNFTITMSALATASASNIAFTTTALPGYMEVLLNWPYFSAETSA